MDIEIQLKCKCGKNLTMILDEETNYKDKVSCTCGREFLIVELTQ